MCRISTMTDSRCQNSSKRNSSVEIPTEEPVCTFSVGTVPVHGLNHCYLPNRVFYRFFGRIPSIDQIMIHPNKKSSDTLLGSVYRITKKIDRGSITMKILSQGSIKMTHHPPAISSVEAIR